MTRVLAIANPKGGVGKTTTTLNLAACLAERQRKVLAIDLDPQASLTLSLGLLHAVETRSIYNALAPTGTPLASILQSTPEGFDLVPANHELNQAIEVLQGKKGGLQAVRAAIEPVRAKYDYILMDCPANAGVLTGSALVAADEVLIPLTADHLALQSLGWFLSIIQKVKESANPTLRVTGIFFNMYDPRTRQAREIVEAAHTTHGAKIPFFATSIRYSANLRDAALAGESILRYDPRSRVGEVFRSLTREVDEGLGLTPENELYFALTRGEEALLERDYPSAYRHYCRATDLNPQLASAWQGRAASTEQWDEQVRCYGQARQLEPDNRDRREALAKCVTYGIVSSIEIQPLVTSAQYLESIGENSLANQLYHHLTERDPQNEEAWLGQGRTSADLREAIGYLQRCLAINPHNGLARKALKSTQERARDDAVQLVDKGQAEVRLGNREAARALFARAAELDPLSDRAVLELARVTEDFGAAARLAQRALEINPQNQEARELSLLLYNPESTAALPAPPRHGWVLPLSMAAVLGLAILVLGVFAIPSLVPLVLPQAQVRTTPTIAYAAMPVAGLPAPTIVPSPADTTTPHPVPTASATRADSSPTPLPPTVSVIVAAGSNTSTPIPTLTNILTRTTAPPTQAPTSGPTITVVPRYPAVTLREPRDGQKTQGESTTFEWVATGLTQTGDHYELKLRSISNPAWEKSYPVAQGKFVLNIRETANYGDYLWSVSILDAGEQVVSPAGEGRRLIWEPRAPSQPPGPEPPPPVFVK